MNVLLVAAANRTTGGAERHVADLIRALPAHDIEVSLVCPPGGDLPELAREHGARVFDAPIAAGFSLGGVRAVSRAIAASKADVVHAHGARAAFFARLADRRASERVIFTVHGIHIDKAGSRARQLTFRTLERILKPRTARFVTVCHSDIAKGEVLGILDQARTTAIHNGIEPRGVLEPTGAFRSELELEAQVPLAISIGRMHEQKDQATLLRAWGLVNERIPAAVLALVGSGELEAELRERSTALGLGGSVRFVNPRPDLTDVYADADAFVLSSLWEGLPYVILEAMDAGLPVVSTDVDGIPEAVVDGETGVLVPARNPEALADGIERVLSDPEGARNLGRAGTARIAREFGIEPMVERLVRVYGEVAGSG